MPLTEIANADKPVDAGAAELTPCQAAHRMGLTTQRIRQLCNDGYLEAVRTPLGRLISASSVVRLLEIRTRDTQTTPA